jgi:antitoxin component YwqK of YwqJK toxin-antitoxin module
MQTWWKKDQLRSRLTFEKGKKEGKQEWYHENGAKERVAYYQQDLNEGDMTAWYPDGSLASSHHFKNGKPKGKQIDYFAKMNLARIFQYDDEGALHGEQTIFYENGAMQSIASYEHGNLHGVKKVWHSDGSLLEEGNYSLGKLEGRFFQKMQDGREIIFTYRDNLKNGLHEIYFPPDQKGQKIRALQANYRNDQPEGIVTEYNEKGTKITETPYVAGVKQGKASLYGADGKLRATVEFEKDVRNGLTVQYFPDGGIFRETPYSSDRREGEERTYHADGSIASIFCYQNDLLEGLAQSWNPEGVLVFEGEYQNGLRHGFFNKYYEDGSPYLLQNFVLDKPEGEKKKYDKNGRVTVSQYQDGKHVLR